MLFVVYLVLGEFARERQVRYLVHYASRATAVRVDHGASDMLLGLAAKPAGVPRGGPPQRASPDSTCATTPEFVETLSNATHITELARKHIHAT